MQVCDRLEALTSLFFNPVGTKTGQVKPHKEFITRGLYHTFLQCSLLYIPRFQR